MLIALLCSVSRGSTGLLYTVYKNEVFFTNMISETVVPNIDFNDIKISYNSAIVKGSFVPPASGIYKFKLEGKPCAQLKLDGISYPSSLCSAGKCAGFELTKVETDELEMHANMTYPLEVLFRAGCTLYSKYLRLSVMMPGSTEYVICPESTFHLTTSKECLDGLYGENCSSQCPECPANSACNAGMYGNGKCECFDGFYGDSCNDICDSDDTCLFGICYEKECFCNEGYYGIHCHKQCNSSGTCSNHGICNYDGECVCDSGYSGPSCNQQGISKCQSGVLYQRFGSEIGFSSLVEEKILDNMYINVGDVLYNSATVTGSLFVKTTGFYKLKLIAKPYGQLSINGKKYPENLGGAGSCWGSTITEVETDEIELIANKLYPFTIKYRSGCSLYSHFIDFQWSNGGDFSTIPIEYITTCEGSCLKGYEGDNCEEFCSLDCGENGECKNGACICSSGYYGSNCNVFCISSETCNGKGVCGVSGSCECDPGYSGPNCSIIGSGQESGSLTQGAIVTYYSSESFGSTSRTEKVNHVSLNIEKSMQYIGLSVDGSLQPRYGGKYRFRASAKPTMQFQISGKTIGSNVFTSGRCDAGEQVVTSEWMQMYPTMLIPFSIKYRSGCSLYDKYVKLEYQMEGSEWKIVDESVAKNPSNSICMNGFYGANCSQTCLSCGIHGKCSDGINGTGKCECDEWYSGDRCDFSAFNITLGTIGSMMLLAMVWVFWPVKYVEYEDDKSEDEENPAAQTKTPSARPKVAVAEVTHIEEAEL